MKKLIILTALVLCFSSCVIRSEKKTRAVTVTGSGIVEVENKEAKLVLSVVSRNEDVVVSSEENAKKMSEVINAVLNAGVGRDSIYTTDYSIRQERIHPMPNSRKPAEIQYVVSNRINVTVKNVETTGKIIDAAIKAGANQMNSLSYSAGNTADAEKQARILAIRDAEQKAVTLVSTSGLTLGQILSIMEREGGYASYENARVYAAKADYSTPVSSGTTKICVTVDVTYELP